MIHVYFSQPFRIRRYILLPYTSIRFNDAIVKERKHLQSKPALSAHSSVSLSTATGLQPFFFFLSRFIIQFFIFELISIDLCAQMALVLLRIAPSPPPTGNRVRRGRRKL